jgi:acyl dehydratase
MRVFAGLDDLLAAAGDALGPGDWLAVEQERIDGFAAATDDHQWIHVDPERAATGPYGTTIAHGYLTLSLLPRLVAGLYRVDGVRMAVNYGLDRVRFPAPVPVGSRIRARSEITSVTPVDGRGVQLVLGTQIEREGAVKPVCVARTVSRLYP